MDKDFWPTLYEDPFAVERIKKCVELADIKPSMNVLDVGCNKMEASKYIPTSCHYIGIDSINGFEIDGGFNLLQKFDRILCLEVLEHLKYPRKTLESIVSHLNDEGIAIISLPNEVSLFHRLRSLFGIVDQECFSESGKHLHLPSLKQAQAFLSAYLRIQKVAFYTSDGCGSRQSVVRSAIRLFPKRLLQLLADVCPSLFSRGFIFVCNKV